MSYTCFTLCTDKANELFDACIIVHFDSLPDRAPVNGEADKRHVLAFMDGDRLTIKIELVVQRTQATHSTNACAVLRRSVVSNVLTARATP